MPKSKNEPIAEAAEPAKGTDTTKSGETNGAAKPVPPPRKGNYILCINPGVALGCDGFPIELCKQITLDLTPDPCCPPDPQRAVTVAIRRCTSDAAPRADCGCGQNDCGCGKDAAGPRYQCSRVKEHVIIQVFDAEELPRDICMRREIPTATERAQPQFLCSCLTECPDCDCSAEPWILLADVIIHKTEGITVEKKRRKFVKPTQCLCDVTTPPSREAPNPDAK